MTLPAASLLANGGKRTERLRRLERAACEGSVARSLDTPVKVAVPQVVDRAAGAAHGHRARRKQTAQQRVWRRAGRRRERYRPKAGPEQQPRPDRAIPARKLAVRDQPRRHAGRQPHIRANVCEAAAIETAATATANAAAASAAASAAGSVSVPQGKLRRAEAAEPHAAHRTCRSQHLWVHVREFTDLSGFSYPLAALGSGGRLGLNLVRVNEF